MATWHEYLKSEGVPPEWPYPVKFGEETELEADVVVLGGGIAGCWAAISAARNGAKVILMEKGDVRRSGAGGPGCDHWCNVPANPLSRVDPDEWAIREMDVLGPYSNGLGIQIQCRENYDTLLEMEQMGGKIRDTDDDFVGLEGRDPETKFMISPRYGAGAGYNPQKGWLDPDFNPPEKRNNVVMRIWGSTFKPVLKKECQRLGVQILDRVMVTSILNEDGKVGGRAVGATGINVRTGEFIIVKAKAVIVSASAAGRLWEMNTEEGGYCTMYSRNQSSDSTMLAWNAGADLTMLEACTKVEIAYSKAHKWYTGGVDASYENVYLVDNDNQILPAPSQGWVDGGAMFSQQDGIIAELRQGIREGKYKLPFFGDFAGMKPQESEATWHMMLNEESTTRSMVETMDKNGFDCHRDQVMNYTFIEWGQNPRLMENTHSGGGIVTDWNLKSSVDGIYAAGNALFSPEDHSFAAATGRYAGRKAAAYVKTIGAGAVSREQIDKEKERILAPTKRSSGIDWKELHIGLTRVMQYFVSEWKTDVMLDIALEEIQRIEENAVPKLYALDPHKLMRCLEDLNLIQHAKLVITAMKERKFSNKDLHLARLDYPEDNEEEAKKYLIMTRTEDGHKFSRIPTRYWGNMKEQYEAHNQDYTGVYKAEN